MTPAAVSLVPQVLNLALYAGDGVSLRLNVTAAGAPLPVSGAVVAQIRATRLAPVVLAEFTADLNEADNGIIVLSLTGDQTATLRGATGDFSGVWDCQWTADGAEPSTLVQGVVTCATDVSRG